MDSHLGRRIPMGRSTIPIVVASLPTSLHSCFLGTRSGIPLRSHTSRKQTPWPLLLTSVHREGSVQGAGGGITLGPMPSRKGYSGGYQKWNSCSTLAKIWTCSYGSTIQCVLMFIKFFIIGVWLIYNMILVSGVQHSDSIFL